MNAPFDAEGLDLTGYSVDSTIHLHDADQWWQRSEQPTPISGDLLTKNAGRDAGHLTEPLVATQADFAADAW